MRADRRLGPWILEERLGAGAFGAVFAAHHADQPAIRRAIKVLTSRDENAVARFRREAELLARVRHPGIVAIHDVGRVGGDSFLVMDLVEGRSLRNLLEETNGAGIPLERALPLAARIARAVGAAHVAGVCHRDLKPENVLVSAGGEPRVLDFGLATAADVERLTRTGTFVGTVGYMAPEQIDGKQGAVGPAADVYALGAILYEIVTGAPLVAGSTSEVLGAALTGNHLQASGRRSELPSALDRLLERAVALSATARFPDANAFAAAVEELEAKRAGGQLRSRRLWLLPATAAATLALVAGVAALSRSTDATPPSVLPRPTTRAPSPVSRATPAPSTSPTPPPAWFLSLPEGQRPDPLPRQLRVGATPGEDVNEKDGSILVFVPATEATAGSDDDTQRNTNFEHPAHAVTVSAYFVGKYELSTALFARFVKATRYRTQAETPGIQAPDGPHVVHATFGVGSMSMNPRASPGATWRVPDGGATGRDDLPVVQVAWIDAVAYAAWAGLRLPTEAEWEVAASWDPAARRARWFPWGDESGDRSRANICFPLEGESAGLLPVTSLPDSALPCGALDMVGNAREWTLDEFTQDFYESLKRGEISHLDPVKLDSWSVTRPHAIRGGDFHSVPAIAHGSSRTGALGSDDVTGFRVALSLDGSQRPRKLAPYAPR